MLPFRVTLTPGGPLLGWRWWPNRISVCEGAVGAHLVLGGGRRAGAAARWRLPVGYERARRAAFADKERLCLLIQLFPSSPRAFGYVLRRLAERPHTAGVLSEVLGDYRPAYPVLHPGYLWSLLRP